MKSTKLIILLATAALLTVLVILLVSPEKKNPIKEAAGTYVGQYTKMVGDDEAEKESFSLILKADGTGIHVRDENEYQVTWTLEGERFTMKESFLGLDNDYAGTLKDGTLDLFRGDPDSDWSYEFVYQKQ